MYLEKIKIRFLKIYKKLLRKEINQKKNKLIIFDKKETKKKGFNKMYYTCVLVKIKKNNEKNKWKFYFRGTHRNRITFIIPFQKLPEINYEIGEVYTVAVEINILD
jgi:hypothetical protein